MSYPPIDPEFYSIGANSGMSDEEIQEDWNSYCEGLDKFHKDIDATFEDITPDAKEAINDSLNKIQAEFDAAPLPVQHGMQPFLDEIKRLLK